MDETEVGSKQLVEEVGQADQTIRLDNLEDLHAIACTIACTLLELT